MSNEWISLNLLNNADREAVALALVRAGYCVRIRKRKTEGNKSIVFLEYRRAEP